MNSKNQDTRETSFFADDPYPNEDTVPADPVWEKPRTANTGEGVDYDAIPVDDNGSSPKALWHALLGSLLGLGLVSGMAELFRKGLLAMLHGRTPPFIDWSLAAVLLAVVNIWICTLLWRRVSMMCGISFAVCAFFSLIPAIVILSAISGMGNL